MLSSGVTMDGIWVKAALAENVALGRGTKTPFIIKAPGMKGNGSRVTAPVSLQDIFPTLLDLCGIQIDQHLDGNNLKPLLVDPKIAWDKAVITSHGPGILPCVKEYGV